MEQIHDLEVIDNNNGQMNLALPVQNLPGNVVEKIHEISCQVGVAKMYPRDEIVVRKLALAKMQRLSVAEKCLYSYPRGGKTVEGASIRMAEILASQWGNIKYGIQVIDKDDHRSVVRTWAWDVERNNQVEDVFVQPHIREKKSGDVKLTSPRDINELVKNFGSRSVRGCILRLIPSDIVEDCKAMVRNTIEKGDGQKTLAQRMESLAAAFESELGVTADEIRSRIKKNLSAITGPEFVQLYGIYKSLKDGQTHKDEWFSAKTVAEHNLDIRKENAANDLKDIQKNVTDEWDAAIKRGAKTGDIKQTIGFAKNKIKNMSKDQCLGAIAVLRKLPQDPPAEPAPDDAMSDTKPEPQKTAPEPQPAAEPDEPQGTAKDRVSGELRDLVNQAIGVGANPAAIIGSDHVQLMSNGSLAKKRLAVNSLKKWLTERQVSAPAPAKTENKQQVITDVRAHELLGKWLKLQLDEDLEERFKKLIRLQLLDGDESILNAIVREYKGGDYENALLKLDDLIEARR